MRISKRAQRRRGNLDDGWEEYLFKFCNRLGVFVCFPVDMHFLMDDPAERDRLIREIWDQHGGDLLEKWAANCHDGETPAVIKHLEKYADTAAYLYYLPGRGDGPSSNSKPNPRCSHGTRLLNL